MKDTSIFNVLLLLVANHIAEQPEAEQEKLKAELEDAGIALTKLIRVANWLKDLLKNTELTASPKKVLRIFDEEENEKIDVMARGCILFLEQTGAINATMREWLIEQAMDLDIEQITLEELQSILSLALFQQYGQANFLKQEKSLIITNPQAVH